MNRSRSRSSEVEEPSEDAILEQELSAMQRKYRVMQNDYRAYREETKRIVNKQKVLISSLLGERLELDTCMSKMETNQNQGKDENNARQLQRLAQTEKDFSQLLGQEKDAITELDLQMKQVERCIADQRKKMGGVNCSTAKFIAQSKRKAVLENRLHKAMVQFNQQLAVNTQLRTNIDHLRQERAVFDNLYKKLARELETCKSEMTEVIESSTQAFEQRDEAQGKMAALCERTEKDTQMHNNEMKELLRTISHDNKIKEFMNAKASDRAEYKAEEAAKKKGDGDKSHNTDLATIQTYEAAFRRIMQVTNQSDIHTIVENFIKHEDENFALFNYVNELCTEVESVTEQVAQVEIDISRFRQEDAQVVNERSAIMKGLEIQYNEAQSRHQVAQLHLREINKILDQLKNSIETMFRKTNCDILPIRQMLGGHAGITNKNVMVYMGLIEQKANELLNIRHYLNSQQKEVQGLAKATQQEGAILPAPTAVQVNISPPCTEDDDYVDLEMEEEDDLKPLTYSELKSKVVKMLEKKHNIPRTFIPNKPAEKANKTSRDQKKKKTQPK